MKLWIWITILVVLVLVAFVAGRMTEKQVVDANGDAVKGKFLSADGKTATLQA